MAPKLSYTDPFTAPTIEVFISTKPNVEELKSERNNTTQLRVTIMKFFFIDFYYWAPEPQQAAQKKFVL
jgi:hypothetical protein